MYLQLEVELHVPPAGVVGVLPQDEPEGRLSLVQVAVLQQVALLGLRSGDQLVLLLVVSRKKKKKETILHVHFVRSGKSCVVSTRRLNKLH